MTTANNEFLMLLYSKFINGLVDVEILENLSNEKSITFVLIENLIRLKMLPPDGLRLDKEDDENIFVFNWQNRVFVELYEKSDTCQIIIRNLGSRVYYNFSENSQHITACISSFVEFITPSSISCTKE